MITVTCDNCILSQVTVILIYFIFLLVILTINIIIYNGIKPIIIFKNSKIYERLFSKVRTLRRIFIKIKNRDLLEGIQRHKTQKYFLCWNSNIRQSHLNI